MSLNGLFNSTLPLTLDGTQSLDVTSLTIDGVNVDITALVPYVGATKTLDMGAQNIKTTHTPVAGADVVNLTTLTAAVAFIDNANALTYLNKITATPQTVAGEVTFSSPLTANSFYTDNSYNWGRASASYNAWSIKRIANSTIIRDLQFRDETDSVTTLLLSSSGQTVYVGLTCDYGTASKVPVWDSNKKLVSSGVDSVKITYLDNVSSDIQTQLNTKATTTYVDTQDGLRVLKSGDTMSGLLQMNGNKVQSSAVPTTNVDLTNKLYVDNIIAGFGYVLKTGDTMTGTLNMGANKITSSYTPVNADDLTRKGYVDTQDGLRVLKTGDTMSGVLTVDATVNVSNRLLGLPDGSPGNFWIGLRGSGTEIERLAIAIAGASTTGIVSGVTISKPLALSSLTADRALFLDGSKIVTASAVTSTELGYVSGVTSAIQTQINTKASTTYVDTADGLRLLKAGDTATGTIYNSAGEFWPYKGGDVNKGCHLFANNADGATYTTYNGGIGSWQGIGFLCSFDSTTRFVFNTRDGASSQTGRFSSAGLTTTASINVSNNVVAEFGVGITKETNAGKIGYGWVTSGCFDIVGGGTTAGERKVICYDKLGVGVSPTDGSFQVAGVSALAGQVNIGVTTNTTPNIKFANSASHIDNSAGEAYLFTAYQGHISVGRNTTRDASTTNLVLGTASTEEAEIISRNTDNTAYMPLSFASSAYTFTNGPVTITNPGTGYVNMLTAYQANLANGFANLFILGKNSSTYNTAQIQYTHVGNGSTSNYGSLQMGGVGNILNWTGGGGVGIGITNPSQKLTVNGNTLTYGAIQAYANGVGGPSMVYSQNDTAGDGYAVMSLLNNSTTGAYWFLNSGGRTSDGGVNTCTLRNDIGTLRLQSKGGYGFQINTTTGYTRKDGGDNSKIIFGPNATWNAFLVVGAGLSEVSTDRAQTIVTNGNLHIDSALSKDLYFNYYSNAAGSVGNTYSYGPWKHGSTMAISSRLTVGADSSRTLMSVVGGSNGTLPGLFGNIGTWPDGANGCLYSQDVPTGANSGGFFIGYNGTGTTGYLTCLAPNVAWLYIQIWAAETYIYYYGALSAYTQSGGWVNVSDEREKEDIQPLKTAKSLERILALKPKHYLRKYYDGNPVPDAVKETRHVGFVAQEVQQSNPHCVSSWCNDKVKNDETEDDGSRLGINYTDYTVHLVGAVQEQQKQMDVLTERNQLLEAWARDQEAKQKKMEERMERMAGLLTQLMAKA